MNEIKISKERYENLLAVTRWYKSMPKIDDFYAGDRFHERMFDFQMSCIPEDAINFDKFYVINFEIKDGVVCALIGDQESGRETSEVMKFVPENSN